MDDSDPDLVLGPDGVCNHCLEYRRRMDAHARRTAEEPVDALVERIRRSGRRGDYDCLIGVSGGVDSSWVAKLCRDWDLRVLAVHFDNGWDSELAAANIRTVLDGLRVDLQTHVVDWEEFRDLQVSFFEASVIDIELPTDNAISALMFRTARKLRIPFLLRGNNDTTEAVMPKAWNHRKTDARNIKAIHRRFGTVPLRTLPMVSGLEVLRWERSSRTEAVNILDRVPYDKSEALRVLESQLGWKPYPRKHDESLFTRFYQSQVLPTKFGVDKRRAHFSALINAGEMTRDDALAELATPIVDAAMAHSDRAYALKKLQVEPERFDRWMQEVPKRHTDYPSELTWMEPLLRANRALRGSRR